MWRAYLSCIHAFGWVNKAAQKYVGGGFCVAGEREETNSQHQPCSNFHCSTPPSLHRNKVNLARTMHRDLVAIIFTCTHTHPVLSLTAWLSFISAHQTPRRPDGNLQTGWRCHRFPSPCYQKISLYSLFIVLCESQLNDLLHFIHRWWKVWTLVLLKESS